MATCNDCKKELSPRDPATYRDRCEDCWTGGPPRGFNWGAVRNYFGTTVDHLKEVSSNVSCGPNRSGRILRKNL